LISLAGYQNELHRVETDDGYILKLHRIFPKQEKNRRGPVLLMHGFLGTAADYLLSGPSISLAYQLANEGYHVFLGNCRGSKFSMKHRVLNPLAAEFWRFSVDQIGMNDLPAIINYILFLTNKKGIFYVGHNQGATALLVLLSARPNFNEKIIQFHQLGPIAFMDHAHPILLYEAKEFEEEVKVLGSFNFKSFIDFSKAIVDSYCPETIPGSLRYCIRLWEFVFGRNQYDTEIDSKILRDIPQFISPTASIRQYLHFLQIARSGKFQSFQSRRFNLVPKEYRLINIKVPTYIYHAAEDLVISRLVIKLFLKSFFQKKTSFKKRLL
jgi:pimeloyl-ACP methyl ester carboxylesterase